MQKQTALSCSDSINLLISSKETKILMELDLISSVKHREKQSWTNEYQKIVFD